MAELAGNQVELRYADGAADRTALYVLRNLATGDTVDLTNQFTSVKRALFLSTTTPQQGICQVAGVVVTVPTNGLAGDAGYLLAWGSAG